jgi:serine/threonine protein kinase
MNQDGNAARASSMFGDYDIIETVGQGGMGIVYRAVDPSLGRTVALKVLKDDLRSNKGVVARFQREGEAVASLDHRNIVQVYSVGTVGDIPYIAMEFVDGDPLSSIMKRERKIDWKRTLAVGEQVAKALGCAHDGQIIHRDIKPGNILVTSEGRAYVSDFGIAKVLTAETQLTVDGSRLGTPQYMSPERCQNAEITFSSDLYSLGVVLFQMMSGRLPYESTDTVDLIRKIVSDPPRRLSEFLPDVPADVERLIAYLIEKKVENRPESAEEWVYLCNRVRNGKSMVEDDSGLESSLKSFRDSQPTPSTLSDSDFSSMHESLSDRIGDLWRGRSLNGKTAIVSAAVAIVMSFLGWLYFLQTSSATANDFARRVATTEWEWTRDSTVVSFYGEMPGVVQARLGNSDWLPSPLGWGGASIGVVRLEGRAGTSWEGHSGLMVIDSNSETGTMLLVPGSSARMYDVGLNMGQGSLYFELGDDGSNVQVYQADLNSQGSNGILRSSYSSILGRAAHDTFQRVGRVDFPDWTSRILVLGEIHSDSKAWGVFLFERGAPSGQSVVPLGSEIGDLMASQDGALMAYSRLTEQENYDLFVASAGEAEKTEMLVISGLTDKDTFAVSPSGELISASVKRTDEVSEVLIYTVDTNEESLLMQDGVDVLWHPNSTDVLVLAPDRKGVNQIWQVATAAPNPRKQITFLEDGVAELGVLAGSGSVLLATSGSNSRPALLIVDLDIVSQEL